MSELGTRNAERGTEDGRRPLPRARRGLVRRSLGEGGSGGWPAASITVLLCSALCLGCERPPAPSNGAKRPQHLATAVIRVAGVPLRVEVASTEETQRKGMMFRERLGPDEAMLFVFDRQDNLSFWMKNTYVDLDLAYIRSDGLITQAEHMKAHDLEPVFSREPVRFALEAPAGWFEAHGARVGARVEIPPDVAATPSAGPYGSGPYGSGLNKDLNKDRMAGSEAAP